MTSPRPTILVLTTDELGAPTGIAPLAERATIRYTDAAGLPDAIAGADALLLWDFFSPAVEAAWQHSDRLRWIHVAAAGVDRLLFPALQESDVVVTNAHGVFDRPIAEFVLASLLAHTKLLHESRDLQQERVWRHREPLPLHGSSALVVGTGGIGRGIARLLGAVGVAVTGAGRVGRPGDDDFRRILPSDQLPSYVGEFDHVINVTPLTQQTRGLFDRAVFDAMRPSAYFVNVGRGASVVETDLVEALRSGSPAGAALDVFEHEPLPAASPLWGTPGVVISPHLSGDVVGWRDDLAAQFVELAGRWLDGADLPDQVDKQLGFVTTRSSHG
ncbi:D-2-hydroxyacid dehydrogenase [Flexivirga meconopsidis]|uniref:D-2-hydroxyacid dehydrogenase n=1 Tax=Flexivirga meconopsidis TaxID=2977121 RepID=UPI0022402BF1